MQEKTVRIGCGSGFWGDTPEGASQLMACGGLHYLVFDYLAEITMSILARARERNPAQGYATDFVTHFITPYAAGISRQGLKIVVNAGGVNPLGCKQAVEAALAAQGVSLKVAAVIGDDVLPQVRRMLDEGKASVAGEMFSGEPLPARPITANAYLGAFPIAAALAAGADIVITGRCVDSALALGPLIHEFSWTPAQLDLLSAGSLAGHVIECGPQCTGGFSTDWEGLERGWADIGFPIVECSADGSFVVTKPAGTGGAVNRQTVAEQVTYETGDPAAYLLPDVACDWSRVMVEEVGVDRVKVSGARGGAAPGRYKVSVTHADGFRSMATLLVRGQQAPHKARAVAAAIFERTGAILAREGHGPYAETSVEVLGAEDAYGAHASPHAQGTREVVLKMGVRHASQKALDVFAREIFPVSTSTVQGIAGIFAGRPKIQPVVRLHSFLIEKADVPVQLLLGDAVADAALPEDVAAAVPAPAAPARASSGASSGATAVDSSGPPTASQAPAGPSAGERTVPLVALAFARSGDKGDISNISVLARRPEDLPLIRAQLTAGAVHGWMAHLVRGKVERHDWPGLHGFNFLLHEALGGGGTASLRYDPQGKAHAQILLDFPIRVPAGWTPPAKGRHA